MGPITHETRSSTCPLPSRHLAPSVSVAGLAAAAVGRRRPRAAPPTQAQTSCRHRNGAIIAINDARRPGLDTGSIRNVTGSRMEGFGNIFVHVDAPADDEPRMNDQMMRGFGLTAGRRRAYRSTRSVRLGDVLMTRKVEVATATSTTSFFDTFTNTADRAGDPRGLLRRLARLGAHRDHQPQHGHDQRTPAAATRSSTRPTPGSPRPPPAAPARRASSSARASTPSATSSPTRSPRRTSPTGSRANDLGFVRELSVEPGETESLVQYVVVGAARRHHPDRDRHRRAGRGAGLLRPDARRDLHPAELGPRRPTPPPAPAPSRSQLPARDAEVEHTTDVAYDVTGKTIADLQADMEAGKRHLGADHPGLPRPDRGLRLRCAAASTPSSPSPTTRSPRPWPPTRPAPPATTGDLLGVPIALKDLYDTKDMPTTGGTLALRGLGAGARRLAGRQAARGRRRDHRQDQPVGVRQLGLVQRERLQQTWNALYPSKTSFGSSGGSATAVGCRPRRGRDGHPDRRLALRAVDRRQPVDVPRHRRPDQHQRRDAADLGHRLRRPDGQVGHRPGLDPATRRPPGPPATTPTTCSPPGSTTACARRSGSPRCAPTPSQGQRHRLRPDRLPVLRPSSTTPPAPSSSRRPRAAIEAAGGTLVPLAEGAATSPPRRRARTTRPPATPAPRAGSATSPRSARCVPARPPRS